MSVSCSAQLPSSNLEPARDFHLAAFTSLFLAAPLSGGRAALQEADAQQLRAKVTQGNYGTSHWVDCGIQPIFVEVPP
jgi:hypothetical protein